MIRISDDKKEDIITQNVYSGMRSFFSKDSLHKVVYADRVLIGVCESEDAEMNDNKCINTIASDNTVHYSDESDCYDDKCIDNMCEMEEMPACVYICTSDLIEVLLPLISDSVIGLKWNGMQYKIVFKEKYSWRLHRLICRKKNSSSNI